MADLLDFDDSNFEKEVEKAGLPVLVDFWAEWCAPCRMISPIVDEFANTYEGKVIVGKVDVDKAPGIASRFSVTSIPTLIIFKDGVPFEKSVGAASKNKIKSMIESVL